MLDDQAFRQLLEHLDRPWSGYRKVRKGVMKRIRRQMKRLGCRSLSEYIGVLEHNREEYLLCQAHLRVTISRFRRDRYLWTHLESTLLPGLCRSFPQGLRIWSAGCACGEEPYSLAMLWHRLGRPVPIEIIATDDDPVCLERARRGCYGRSSLKELAPDDISAFFTRQGAKYCVLPHLRTIVQWRRHDLLGPPLPGPFQMIFLRNNLLTYYGRQQRADRLRAIVGELAVGGLLVIGSHEKLPENGLSPPGHLARVWEHSDGIHVKQHASA